MTRMASSWWSVRLPWWVKPLVILLAVIVSACLVGPDVPLRKGF